MAFKRITLILRKFLFLILLAVSILVTYIAFTHIQHQTETSQFVLNDKFSLKSKFWRKMSKNFRRDFSVDDTCTLPYVSRSCYNLVAEFIYDDFVKNVEPVSQLKSGDVIMVSTNLCQEFFVNIFPRITTYVILISHNSDDPLEPKFMKYLEDKRLAV